ncbi:DUF4335 domain-containing protein [Almyronema epifaneia]|uniref:DUF4335 domain-containing protein n=1 Tax=Almyronema epifaneia S1 TaxID=2991925 RepID=A0ABW6IBH5_9CYAN
MAPSSQSIHRRYVSESWVLEVVGNTSVLSGWSDRPVIQKLRFRLTRQPITSHSRQLKGGQPQLAALTAAIQSYTQSQLLMAVTSAPTMDTTAQQQKPPTAADVFLVAQGLTQHRLHLGHLAPQPAEWDLTTLELADLVTVLENFEAEAIALPPAPQSRPRWRTFTYTGTAAASLLLAVGVATLLQPSPPSLETAQTAGDQTAEVLTEAEAELDPPAPSPTSPDANQPENRLPATTAPPATNSNQAAGGTPPPAPQPAPGNAAPSSAPPPQTKQPAAAPPAAESPETSAPVASSAPDRGDDTPEETADSSAIASAPAPAEFSRSRPSLEAAPTQLPQLAEIQRYLAEAWQPEATLETDLVYDWVLAADGSVAAVNPVNESAAAYRDRLPVVATDDGPVFSPPGGEGLTVRVTLTPTGEIETALP